MNTASSILAPSSFISPNHRRIYHSKFHSTLQNDKYNPILTPFTHKSSFKLNTNHKLSIKAKDGSDESDEKATPDSKKHSFFSTWKKWAVGIIFSILLPSFGHHKLHPIVIVKRKVDDVLERVETISEVVEELAEGAQKLSIEVHKRLPQDADELKDATKLVHKLALAVDKEAERTQELIHKLDKMGEEIEELIEVKIAHEKTTDKKTSVH